MEVNTLLDHIAGLSPDQTADLSAIVEKLRTAVTLQDQDNARLRTEAMQLADRREEMLRRVISAQDERCRRISRELHDEISQSLAAMALDLETLQAKGCITEEDTLVRLSDLRQRLLGALDEVHRIIADLRPAMLEDMGLLPALRRYATQRFGDPGVHLHATSRGLPDRLPPHLETTLYRIAQEAINNAAQHAAARNVWVDVAYSEEQFTLSVRDDGCGFAADRILYSADARSGIGLFSMRERAALAGGSCEISSQSGSGTTVQVQLPFVKATSASAVDISANLPARADLSQSLP